MPLYEYECDACRQRFEAIRKFSESDLDKCSLCGKGPVRRLMSSPAIQFKGTGWYITDYSSKGKAAESSGSAKDETKKSDAGSSDTSSTKPDTSSTKSDSGRTATAKSSET